jgi:signal peptidase I
MVKKVHAPLTSRRILFWLLLIVSLSFAIRWSGASVYYVSSASMAPTFLPGDFLLINKTQYRYLIPFTRIELAKSASIERGDVVVFRYPNDLRSEYVKRVVGLPGDRIELVYHTLYINGVAQLQEDAPTLTEYGAEYAKESLFSVEHWVQYSLSGMEGEEASMWSPGKPYIVPPESVFVLGDHRDSSTDSREWGHVPFVYIRGKVSLILWSNGEEKGNLGIIRGRRFLQPVY